LERREFVRSALVTAGVALGGAMEAAAADGVQEFYQMRTYTLRSGAQGALAQAYFEHALIPAATRLGLGPVGAFKLDIGPETPTFYALIPGNSAGTLATLDMRLSEDAEYRKAGAAFLGAPATAPAFQRMEVSLLSAFAGWPKLVAPKRQKRIFQLRTYESPSYEAHVRKVGMFNEAEIGIFVRAGLTPVFFGQTLVGGRMPSLTYMLTFADLADMNTSWGHFGADPAWKELSHKPGNTDPEIVSNISNLYLSPLGCSQI
jgi:hypothetical protein